MKVATTTFVLTLVAAFGIGTVLIFLLTRNFRVIVDTVRRFSEGDYSARIPLTQTNELATIGHTFNQMADTLLQNMDDLKEVDKVRRELIANVSHDLCSPMSVISGYIETLIIKEESLTHDERRKYLEIVFSNSNKLKKLVSDLFELSRLESSQCN